MSIVYQTDSRTQLTYAYERRRVWNEEKGKMVVQRKLLGRVNDMSTKEIVPTDGRCRRRSPYLTNDEKVALREEPREFQSAVFLSPSSHETSGSFAPKDEINLPANTVSSTTVVDEFHSISRVLTSIQQDIRKICSLLEKDMQKA